MDGNSTFRHSRTSVLSIVAIEAPVVVTSTELDEQLAACLRATGRRAPACSRGSPVSTSVAGGRRA